MGKLLGSVMILCWVVVFTAIVFAVKPADAVMAVGQYATGLFNICGGLLMLGAVWRT